MRSNKQAVPPSVNGDKYDITKKLGAGCFGEVYKGIKKDTKVEVAVKFEDVSNASSQQLQLEHEANILSQLRNPTQPQGFAEFYYSGREGNWHCLVMEFLGKSLEDNVQSCGGKLTPKTSCLIAEQILMRIEYLHSKCIVHRDIKPENFMMGIKDKCHHIYLIDFGLSKKYFDDKGGKHAPYRQKLNLTGTARYASINAHRGIEQSRRDDLEAIGHMLMYFLRGHLPWSGLEAKNKAEKYRKIKETKEVTRLSDLCAGFPEAFMQYLDYARGLEFQSRPDYNMCKKLFADERQEMERQEGKRIEDWHMEFIKELPNAQLQPIVPYTGLTQPDDERPAARSRGMCCFGGGKVDD
eukprot:gb/GFBE01075847.1/.p1 GENE.gb/GFBE01075847.1/~~gb/GFBE01075847.1/.p1  ORF type:complete len:353 (+),score=87.00 gb/GFBE01075847.1/:1-1059(+)